jgi:transposase-like protein
MRELSVAEQRYQAVLAVISDGLSISQVAEKVGVSRQTQHSWVSRYEAEGLEGLVDRSHRPTRCPHQMPADVEEVLFGAAALSAVLGSAAVGLRVGQAARGAAPLLLSSLDPSPPTCRSGSRLRSISLSRASGPQIRHAGCPPGVSGDDCADELPMSAGDVRDVLPYFCGRRPD